MLPPLTSNSPDSGEVTTAGVRVICVWDARGGPSMTTQHDTMTYGVEVVYEAEFTADTYIEAKSQELLRITHNRPLVFVATDDRATRDLVNGQGALTLTTKMLIQVRGVPQEQLPLGSLEGSFIEEEDGTIHGHSGERYRLVLRRSVFWTLLHFLSERQRGARRAHHALGIHFPLLLAPGEPSPGSLKNASGCVCVYGIGSAQFCVHLSRQWQASDAPSHRECQGGH